jgi:ribosomal protein S18 acetylase RimI-like enzyme
MNARSAEVKADLNQSLTTDLVRNEDELITWAEIYCQAFGRMDRWNQERCRWSLALQGQLVRDKKLWFFLGRNGQEPVVTGQLVTTQMIGGIYSIGTPQDFRGQGFGSTMTVDIAKAAVILGLQDLYLIAQNEPNKRFYERLGFKEVLQTQTWQQK